MSQLSFMVPRQEHAALILGWRTQPHVTRFMFSDVTHDVQAQQAWLAAASQRSDYRHWLVINRDQPIGLVNLQAIDWRKRRSASGFYIGEEAARPLGGFVLPYLYNHGFFDLGFEAMTAEVMAGNTEVLRLHHAHGYVDDGPRPGGVVKNGETHVVHRLLLTRDAWLALPTLHRYRADFPWPQ